MSLAKLYTKHFLEYPLKRKYMKKIFFPVALAMLSTTILCISAEAQISVVKNGQAQFGTIGNYTSGVTLGGVTQRVVPDSTANIVVLGPKSYNQSGKISFGDESNTICMALPLSATEVEDATPWVPYNLEYTHNIGPYVEWEHWFIVDDIDSQLDGENYTCWRGLVSRSPYYEYSSDSYHLRNEDGVICKREGYFVYPNLYYKPKEVVVDFNKEVGETFRSNIGGIEQDVLVTNKWTVNLDGERRAFRILPELFDCPIIVVEGFGALKHGNLGVLGENYWDEYLEDDENLDNKYQTHYHVLNNVKDEDGHVVYDRFSTPIGKPTFDAENTLTYNIIEISSFADDRHDPYLLTQMTLRKEGDEEHQGTSYMKYSWGVTEDKSSDNKALYLMREDNGAYYLYVDENNFHSTEVNIPAGEYLMYDFNMNEGETFEAPVCLVSNLKGNILEEGKLAMCHFTVKETYTDEFGRRCLLISPELAADGNWDVPEEISVVEGVGVLSYGNLAICIFATNSANSTKRTSIEFVSMNDRMGNLYYISPTERKAGFAKEKDYEWVYGMYSAHGNLSYHKMGFNHHVTVKDVTTGEEKIYRRFVTKGQSAHPSGPFRDEPFKVWYLREEDGIFYLYHSIGSTTIENVDNDELEESVIYDFLKSNTLKHNSLSAYTTEGYKDLPVRDWTYRWYGSEQLVTLSCRGQEAGNTTHNVISIQGLGVVKGGILPCINTIYRLPADVNDISYCGAALVSVHDGEGNLIFSQEMPSDVEAIPMQTDTYTAPELRIFDLMGRELQAPVPGQPYIKGGKVMIGQ